MGFSDCELDGIIDAYLNLSYSRVLSMPTSRFVGDLGDCVGGNRTKAFYIGSIGSAWHPRQHKLNAPLV